jgi:hypothetical protein
MGDDKSIEYMFQGYKGDFGVRNGTWIRRTGRRGAMKPVMSNQ